MNYESCLAWKYGSCCAAEKQHFSNYLADKISWTGKFCRVFSRESIAQTKHFKVSQYERSQYLNSVKTSKLHSVKIITTVRNCPLTLVRWMVWWMVYGWLLYDTSLMNLLLLLYYRNKNSFSLYLGGFLLLESWLRFRFQLPGTPAGNLVGVARNPTKASVFMTFSYFHTDVNVHIQLTTFHIKIAFNNYSFACKRV